MRLENWPSLLAIFLTERANTPFTWGQSDCCLFAADAAQAITGTDFAADYRGKYDDARGALAFVEAAGGLASLVPFETVAPSYAQRGDIVLVENVDGRDCLAVHCGSRIAGQGPDGIAWLPLEAVKQAWRTEA